MIFPPSPTSAPPPFKPSSLTAALLDTNNLHFASNCEKIRLQGFQNPLKTFNTERHSSSIDPRPPLEPLTEFACRFAILHS